MDPGHDPQNPLQLQQAYLAQVEREKQNADANVRRLLPPGQAPTRQQVEAVVRYTEELETYFHRFDSVACELKAAGCPELWNRLDAYLRDLDGAKRIYYEMIRSSRETDREIRKIARRNRHEIAEIYHQVHENQREVYDAANKQWHAATFNRPQERRYCPYCGYPLGDYLPHEYCGHCSRKL